GHARGDDVEPVSREARDERAEVGVDAFDLVDAQLGEDLPVQCDGRTGELTALLEAVGGLAREPDGDGPGVDRVLQGAVAPVAFAVATAVAAAARHEGERRDGDRGSGDAADACRSHAWFLRIRPPARGGVLWPTSHHAM